MKKLKITVLDNHWTVRLLTPMGYKRLHGVDSAAITDTEKKTVDLQNGFVSLFVIRHELFHVYVDATMTNSTDLTADQMEEISANIIGTHGEKMIEQGNEIFEYFKE